jgi:NAD-dependent dihydropyrimidine dehydrogenase PreA subunit
MIQNIDELTCTGCGICIEKCPMDVLIINENVGKAVIKYPEDCMTCFECELNCPSGAIYVHPFIKEIRNV